MWHKVNFKKRLTLLISEFSFSKVKDPSLPYIIIMSYGEHGFTLLSFAIRLYRPSLLVGLLDNILCPYRVVVDKF